MFEWLFSWHGCESLRYRENATNPRTIRARGAPTPAPIATARLFEDWNEDESEDEVDGLVFADVEWFIDSAPVLDVVAAETEDKL